MANKPQSGQVDLFKNNTRIFNISVCKCKHEELSSLLVDVCTVFGAAWLQ